MALKSTARISDEYIPGRISQFIDRCFNVATIAVCALYFLAQIIRGLWNAGVFHGLW